MIKLIGNKGAKKPKEPREDKNSLFSKQIARIVDVISEGEISKWGANDDIYQATHFNETPIKDGSGNFNFKGVELDARKGSDSQTYIKDFEKVETEHAVGITVENATPHLEVVDANTDDVRVTIKIPGLLESNSKGDILATDLQLKITIKPDGGVETTVFDGANGSSDPGYIYGKCTSEYQRSYLIEDLTGTYGVGPWQVKVYKLSADSTSVKIQKNIVWDTYTTIQNIKLNYMSTAVVGVKIDTEYYTDNVPTRQYDVYGIEVRYPDTYNPVTRIHSGIWDGETFNTGYTNNAAWCILDILTSKRYGFGYSDDKIDFASLYELSQYNDGNVTVVEKFRQNDGTYSDSTSVEPRFTLNLNIDDRQQGLTVLMSMAQSCRAFPVWVNGKITFVQDSPADVTRIASPSNVIGGMFEYEGTPKRQRFSVAKITYNDIDNFSRQTIVNIEDDEAISTYGYNPIDIFLIGCNSRSEAIRRASYIIYTGLHETELIKFGGGTEWADCIPGEVIAVQDPEYADTNLSGRITASTTTSITLDRTITLGAGTNTVILQQNKTDAIEKVLTNAPGAATVLTWTDALTEAPQKENVWVVSTASVALRKFRVMKVEEVELGSYRITGIQYDPNKYAAVEEGFTFEAPLDSRIKAGSVVPPTDFTCQAYSYVEGAQDNRKYGVLFSWVGSDDPRVDSYEIQYKFNNTSWISAGFTGGTSFDWRGVEPGVYDFQVKAVALTGDSTWVSIADFTVATYISIQPVTNLIVKGGDDVFDGKDCTMTWTPPAGAVYDSTDSAIITTTPITGGFIKKYLIEVYKTSDLSLLKSYYTASAQEVEYCYFYADNLVDNGGVPVRALTFKVYAVSYYDDLSIATTKAVSNPAPDMSSSLPVVTSRQGYLEITWAVLNDYDMSFYNIYFGAVNPPTDLIAKIYHPNSFYQALDVEYGTSYYVQIQPYDGFGGGIKSQVPAGATPLLISNINIDVELADSIVKTATVSYAGDIESLYDRTFNSGGITFTPAEDQYIQYAYNLENYFDRVGIWSANANTRVYIGLSVDGSAWTYFKALGSHLLDTDKQLDLATNLSDAKTNYWQLAAGFNTALLPNNQSAKYVRLFFTNVNATTIYEFVPSRLLISELAAIENLSSISANIGSITAGVLQSPDFVVGSQGMQIDLNNKNITIQKDSDVKLSYVGSTGALTMKGSITILSPIDCSTIVGSPPNGSSGLYLTASYLGYWMSGAPGSWKTYMDNSGNFKLGDPSTGPGLSWNQGLGSLTISGNITLLTPINYADIVGTKPPAGATVGATWGPGGNIGGTNLPADNATVGATWGTNLSNIPATLGAPAGSGLFLSATNMGYYTGGLWKTYIDNSGNMILGDPAGTAGLSWNQGAASLTIKGSITLVNTIPSGSVSGLAATATSSDFSVVTGVTKPADNATVGATWGTNLGNIPATLGTPSGSGLFLSSTNMGYYSAGAWKTYMDSSGNMVLGNPAGTAGLSWNQAASTLTIKGNITLIGGLDATQITTGLLNVARFGDGTIDTIKMIANSITEHPIAYTAGAIALPYAVATTIQTLTFTSKGGTLVISASCICTSAVSGYPVSIGLYRGTTGVADRKVQMNFQVYPTTTFPAPYNAGGGTLTFSELLAVGTYTYYLVAITAVGAGSAQNRMIKVTEYKK